MYLLPMSSFLVDEDLSPTLCRIARENGYLAYAAVYRGWSGYSDRRLLDRAITENLVIVTNNAADFLSLVGRVDLHPGLVIIVDNVPRAEQQRLFGLALGVIRTLPDMVNRIVEVTANGKLHVYDLPRIV